ncbi:MAG: 2,3-bisphosphoglycerate-independent phosphoglycerate mutase, partial [Bacteroidota bacterium]|nr:2,3-bisphosphoglycerate-independent phosphoglycerate mutase [Bacteroidota bacterium]
SGIGRYYAMDRDQRWERTKKAYDLLLHGQANHQVAIKNMEDHIKSLYGKGVTDEFLEATLCDDQALCIAEGDAVLCWNFRTDRCRQITQALCYGIADDELVLESIDTNYVTMTRYDVSFDTIPVLFAKENIENTLGEAISKAGLTQLRMAETEKYPHVTYFFNGGRETPFDGEERCVIPSPKVATYDLQPEMSAYELTAEAKRRIKEDQPDFLCLNFANPDMVGHTGDFAAVIKAVETVDGCAQDVIETLLEEDYQIFLTADHGNADFMINEDGSPNTAHTTNLVPVWSIARSNPLSIHDGSLCDIATWVKVCLEIS